MFGQVINRIKIAMLTLVASISLAGCSDNEIEKLYFVGDSIMARWDLDEYFPHYITYNQGVSGAGIEYIESLKGSETGRDLVIMIGTNNISADMDVKSYARQYVDAILNLSGRRVFLYSILPRDFNGEQETLLPVIRAVNNNVQTLIADEPSVCYIDVYDKFIYKSHIDPGLFNDRLHLSPSGYEILTKALIDCI